MATVFSLPDELLLKVFSYLDVSDISVSVANVCTHWHILANDSVLWSRLEFTVDKSMDLAEVTRLLPYMTQLRYVRFQWRTDTSDIVQALSTNCPSLVGIKMICCGFIDKDCIRKLFHNYQKLKLLSLGKSWAIPHQCLDDIVLFTSLTSLDLSNSLLTPDQFILISVSCTKIVSINIDYVRGLSEDNLIYFIMPRKVSLESLSVYGELLTDNIFKQIQLCSRLKLLHISTCREFTDTCFDSITKLKYLTSLTMRKAVKLSSEALWRFYFFSDTIKQLSRLYISAKRNINHDDVSLWQQTNSAIENSLIDQYCTCILTKCGFKTYKLE